MTNLAIERQGPVGLITLNRPERHNAFDDVLIAELTAAGFPAGAAFTADKQVRVMVGPFASDEARDAARTKLESSGYRVLRAW